MLVSNQLVGITGTKPRMREPLAFTSTGTSYSTLPGKSGILKIDFYNAHAQINDFSELNLKVHYYLIAPLSFTVGQRITSLLYFLVSL